MPSTPLKAVPRGNENTPEPARSLKKTPGSQRKDPWSRSSPRRFSGHGSIYNTTAAGATPLSNTTPSKHQSSSLSQRYATPAERVAGSTPTRALSSTFASSTSRFSGKASLYGAAAASVPGAGEYNPEMHDKIKGLVKLQACVRRRQSRGIFAAQERFQGEGSIYPTAQTPGVGQYSAPVLEAPKAAAGGGSFAHGVPRFEGSGAADGRRRTRAGLRPQRHACPSRGQSLAPRPAESRRVQLARGTASCAFARLVF
jgi:hypothetical protein